MMLLTGDQGSPDFVLADREPVDHLVEEVYDGLPLLGRDGARAVDHQPEVGVCVDNTLRVCEPDQRTQQREQHRKRRQAGRGGAWCRCAYTGRNRPAMCARICAAGAIARGGMNHGWCGVPYFAPIKCFLRFALWPGYSAGGCGRAGSVLQSMVAPAMYV